MAHHSRHEQHDNDSRQQPNRTDNDVAWQGQVNSADSENRGYGLSTRLWFVNVLWHLCFRINEIRDLINTCADHRVNYVTLALSGPVSKCGLSRLRSG